MCLLLSIVEYEGCWVCFRGLACMYSAAVVDCQEVSTASCRLPSIAKGSEMVVHLTGVSPFRRPTRVRICRKGFSNEEATVLDDTPLLLLNKSLLSHSVRLLSVRRVLCRMKPAYILRTILLASVPVPY